ncbi:glycosyltransferase family 2 protein [Allohahella marinimesophila]|uniref:Glycosyltransferase n=1 Tax=Allohahella marinimesophila TaxID=1054972 RepID=A0ABP7PXS3_9GAMM
MNPMPPELTVIIPSYNRPELLPRAVNSALEQSFQSLEVLVVDDGSPQPISLPEHPRLRVVRLEQNAGNASARNAGLRAARGRYVCYLDDDDRLLPNMAADSMAALAQAHDDKSLPDPIAVLSGLEVIDKHGQRQQTRLPPTLPKGSRFFLEPIPEGQSFISKQTLVVERDLLLEIGGYDEDFRSRVHTEMFLRLNAVCSILGIPRLTYQLISHDGDRISGNRALRQESFERLIQKHGKLFRSSPRMYADFVYRHAVKSRQLGQHQHALKYFLKAFQIHPEQAWRQSSRSLWHTIVAVKKRFIP